MNKLKLTIPFLILFILFGFLYYELFHAKPNELPSALIGEPVPAFSLPLINNPAAALTQNQLKHHVTLLNVWASWCYACGLEHEMLMKISREYHIPVYSILYKDDPAKAAAWLHEHGNPFVMTGNDSKGDVAIDFGVYGTPETFVISPAGNIVYRHIGAIDQETWDKVLWPLIKKLEQHE